MRCMVIMKANRDSEAGVMPGERALTAMGNFNEELVNAGVMLAGEGLHPSARGVRIAFSADAAPAMTDGPFPGTGELVAGFWLWQVRSMAEAVAWARRIPNPDGDAFEVEIRPVFEAEDFGEQFTPEAREQEERLRMRLEGS